MLKKLALTVLLCMSMGIPSFASVPPPQIMLDLVEVKTSMPARVIDGVTMVPMRAIAEKAGCKVKWIPAKQQMEVARPHEDAPGIIVNVGQTRAYYSRYEQEISDFVSFDEELPTAPALIKDVVFVPVDFLAAGLGYTIDKNVDDNTIYLFSPEHMNNQKGEGIGNDVGKAAPQAKALSKEQKQYVVSLRTANWTELSEKQQEAAIEMILQWWQADINYTADADFADKLGRQMGQYYRTNTDMGLFQTACELEGFDFHNFVDKAW